MKYGAFPGLNRQASRIFLGTASAPFNTGEDCGELMEQMLLLGINALDTARVYGGSEGSLGRWLVQGKNRDRVILLSKCGHPSPDGRKRVHAKEMREDLETSLEQLRTKKIDIYLLHRDDPEVPVGEILETFNAMKAEGRIGVFGGSNWTCERIREANDYAAAHGLEGFSVTSPQYGLARQVKDPWGWNCVTLGGKEHLADRVFIREQGLAVVSYSSLGRGMMSGRFRSDDPDGAARVMDSFGREGFAWPENYERLRRCEILAGEKGATVSQIALSWMFHQNLNLFAVISSRNPDRMRQNAAALEISLTEEECGWLDLQTDSLS